MAVSDAHERTRRGIELDELACTEAEVTENGAREIEIVLPAVPLSVSVARHAVGDLLHDADAVPALVVEDVLLLVSELVTNAVLHAGTDTTVSASVRAGRVVVAVSDYDPHHAPFLAERGSMASNGRGVLLVDALASDWGIELMDESKVVWFEASYDVDEATQGDTTHETVARAGGFRLRIQRRAQAG